MIKNRYELQSRYDARASFYGKAEILEDEKGNTFLMSYSTIVAGYKDNKLFINGWFSQTTGRHINEFLRQTGNKTMSKKQMQDFENTCEIDSWEI